MQEKFYQILKFLFAVSCIVLWIWAMFSTPGEREKMAFSGILLLWCVFAIAWFSFDGSLSRKMDTVRLRKLLH